METAPDDAYYQDEARFALALAARPDTIVAAVISGCRPETDEGFEAWLDETATPLNVGYRRVLHVMPDELSTGEGFRANVRRIGQRGKTFDICVTEAQLPIGRDLARACPETQFILDHCGVPAIAGGDLGRWVSAIDELAALPNVACKISGVVAYCGPDQEPEAVVRPYVEHCIEVFGTDRVVWGGDWPVVSMRCRCPNGPRSRNARRRPEPSSRRSSRTTPRISTGCRIGFQPARRDGRLSPARAAAASTGMARHSSIGTPKCRST